MIWPPFKEGLTDWQLIIVSFVIKNVSWEAAHTKPTPWVTDAIVSCSFLAPHWAEELLPPLRHIIYPSSPQPLPSMLWGCLKLVSWADGGLCCSFLCLLSQPRRRVVDYWLIAKPIANGRPKELGTPWCSPCSKQSTIAQEKHWPLKLSS